MNLFRSSRQAGAALAAGALVAVALIAPTADAAAPTDPPPTRAAVERSPDGKYIVELVAAPVATYTGGLPGLAATASRNGGKLDRSSPEVGRYRAYLDDVRNRLLATLPGVRPFYEYDWAFSGFAALMSYEQATALAALPEVARVHANHRDQLDTEHSPEFLGLSGPGGLWEQAGGPEEAGEGVVIGIVDGGFTPESGSFAPLAEPAPVPDDWDGTCQPGDGSDLGGGAIGDGTTQGTQEAEIDCDGDVYNNKVIGANYFVAGFGAPDPDEFLSPRDAGGHGSHTGSTAGGNFGVPATVDGIELGEISGMAPRARIATYKVCWQTPAGGSCASADTTAAINKAVADGVDVINYSISGSTSSAVTPQATAFRNAAAAGVFVAVSAGNSGTSGPSTVAHNYPWVTTTAASTQDRVFQADAVLGNGDVYTGSSIATGVPETSAVYGGAIPADGATVADAKLCLAGSIDPDQVEDKIVVCERGVTARVNKAQVVAELGGVGVVLANDPGNGTSLNTEYHVLPTVHLSYEDGQDVIDYVGRTEVDPDATIEITEYERIIGDDVTAPSMAAFSSLGPAQLGGGDILKPDITAPGVDVLATLAPYATAQGQLYGFNAGTSMSSPHIAGIAAMLRYLHPDWSPMAIKSAIMTSAYQENNQGDPIDRLGVDADGFNYGAGHVDPPAATEAQLAYETGLSEWGQWLCGLGQIPPTDPLCDDGPIDPSELNLASVAVNDVAGFRAVERTVTNLTDDEIVATASFEQPDGFELSVQPSQLTVPAGGTATFTLRIQRTSAGVGEWEHGAFSWDTGDTVVRSPVAVKAAAGGMSWELLDTGSSGSFRGLDAVSEDVAWATSDDAEVLLTTDGGETFVDVSPPEAVEDGLLLRDVEARSDREALVLAVGNGDASRVYRTTDGGATWKETFRGDDEAAFFDCMAMFNRQHGFVMGDPVDGKFQVLVTSDAGRTWTLAPSSGMPDALEGEFGFAASGTCSAATGRKGFFGTGGGAEARVFRTTDHGMTWEVSSTPIQSTESGGIFSIDFRTNKVGIAIGGDFAAPEEATDALARTTDGGVTWELVDESKAPTGYRSGSAWYADDRGDKRSLLPPADKLVVLAVGPTGSDVSANRGKSWEQFDAGAFHSVECAGTACWASGPGGRIARLVGAP